MVYCGRLSLVADLLQALFKDAYTLQKALLELLDRMSLNTGASEDEVSDIVSCMCFIVNLSQRFYTFDRIELFLIFFGLSCFLSYSQLAGYLLYHFQLGHGTACKHVEIRYQVSRPETLKMDGFNSYLITSFKRLTIQTEFKVPVIGGGTSSSW